MSVVLLAQAILAACYLAALFLGVWGPQETIDNPTFKAIKMRNLALNGFLVLISLTVGLLIGEIAIRTLQPIELRIRGASINLARNMREVIANDRIPKIDKVIINTRNAIGFRGENPPVDFKRRLSLITVGGSTTQCYYITDGKTWTDELGKRLKKSFKPTWVNNAGLDGQTTYGHIVLLKDYIVDMKPTYALFLVGLNDVGREKYNGPYDEWIMAQSRELAPQAKTARIPMSLESFSSVDSFLTYTSQYSDLGAFLLTLNRSLLAVKGGLGHGAIDITSMSHVEVSAETLASLKKAHLDKGAPANFKKRVEALVDISRKAGIEPILVTQPALWGHAKDNITGVDIGTISAAMSPLMGMPEGTVINCGAQWDVLDLYNDVTRQVGKDMGVFVVDLGAKMPKSTDYFYDWFHFTNKGAAKVAEIIYKDLCPHISGSHSTYQIASCE